MSVNEYAIELSGVTKEYPGTIALKGVDLKVEVGRIHGFLGPNGAGKSTTMNIISGLIPPTQGEVKVLGRDIACDNEHAKLSIGLLPEHPPLYLNMRVLDYLTFSQNIHGSYERAELERVLESLGLVQVSKRLIGNLSKGYRQRVAMAQALVYQAPIIILDEPMVGLDPNAIAQMRELIKDLKKNHTVLLSTHQLHEAANICDDITIIHDGLIKKSGKLGDLEHQLKGSTTYLAFIKSFDENLLRKIEAIEGVVSAGLVPQDSDDINQVLIQVKYGLDKRSELVSELVSHCELLEFREHQTSLEDIFKQVVSHD